MHQRCAGLPTLKPRRRSLPNVGRFCRHAEHSHAGGTATRSIAEGFGTLSAAPDTTDIELRASWTPAPRDLGSHLEAWSDMICAFAGLPPEHAADVSTAGP